MGSDKIGNAGDDLGRDTTSRGGHCGLQTGRFLIARRREHKYPLLLRGGKLQGWGEGPHPEIGVHREGIDFEICSLTEPSGSVAFHSAANVAPLTVANTGNRSLSKTAQKCCKRGHTPDAMSLKQSHLGLHHQSFRLNQLLEEHIEEAIEPRRGIRVSPAFQSIRMRVHPHTEGRALECELVQSVAKNHDSRSFA